MGLARRIIPCLDVDRSALQSRAYRPAHRVEIAVPVERVEAGDAGRLDEVLA